MNTILQIEDLNFKYPDYPDLKFPELFRNLNLKLGKGEFRIILGKPESGKSTLVKILLSALPRYSGGDISGSMYYKDIPLSSLRPYDLIDKIGAVLQDPDEQIVTTSCDTEIAFALESMGIHREEIKERIDKSLHKAGIPNLKYRNPATLSGGEKKKLLLACLYASDPEVWVLDEILDELDPGTVRSIITDLTESEKTVLLFSSKMLDIFLERSLGYSVLSNGMLTETESLSEEQTLALLEKEGLVIGTDGITGTGLPGKNSRELVSVKNLEYRYPGNRDFFLEIENFTLAEGEIVALAGANGSGKTTLGKLIAGLHEKEKGQLEAVSCGYLFQNPDYQIFLPSVEEELGYGLNLSRDEIDNTISGFRLPEGKVPPSLMSYGTRKRLQAAVYYLLDKDVYILDEADAGMSLEDFRHILNLLYRPDKGIIIISHNLELCGKFAHRGYLMENGHILREIDSDLYAGIHEYFHTLKDRK